MQHTIFSITFSDKGDDDIQDDVYDDDDDDDDDDVLYEKDYSLNETSESRSQNNNLISLQVWSKKIVYKARSGDNQ